MKLFGFKNKTLLDKIYKSDQQKITGDDIEQSVIQEMLYLIPFLFIIINALHLQLARRSYHERKFLD